MLLVSNLIDSRTGLMLRGMRDSSEATASLGVDLQWLRTRVFMLSALLGSVAGSLFAHYVSFTSVQSFTVDKSISFLLIPVLGGVRSLWGVVLGAMFVTILPELLSQLGDIHQILFGLALVAVVVLLPDGLMGLLRQAAGKLGWSRARRMSERHPQARRGRPQLRRLHRVAQRHAVGSGTAALIGLIGPNGSGKTTLFNIVSGYLPLQAGTIAFRGQALTTQSVQDRNRAGMVRTFQTPKIFERMTRARKHHGRRLQAHAHRHDSRTCSAAARARRDAPRSGASRNASPASSAWLATCPRAP